MSQQFKYFAFISYNSKDTEWGKRLQRKLEHYRMPATLCSEHGWERTPIKPVFFAPTDIQPGGLTEELQERLRASRNLIVICSPNSARSEWVGKEIEFFHQLGRTKQIHFFIVDGTPHSNNPETECFNPIVDTLGLPEILGANIHEKIYRWPWLNKERAYVQLISKLLGVEFDAIWQRHKRLLIQRTISWAVGIVVILAALFGVWNTSKSVDVTMTLNEVTVHNDNLPPLQDAVVTLTLDNETKTDTIRSLDASLVFANIPHRYIGKEARVQIGNFPYFEYEGERIATFLPVDTIVRLQKNTVINVNRDERYYGLIRLQLWDSKKERFVSNTEIVVEGRTLRSDSNGSISLAIPLENQKTNYNIQSSSLHLIDSSIEMPCGPGKVLEVE
jgi:hypothetical protein